jgi:spermidine/putrescine-binding protein
MHTDKLIQARRDGLLSRRQFAKHAAAIGVGMVGMKGFARPAAAASPSDLTYFGWSGYDDPEFHKVFQEKYGGLPTFNFWGSEDEALTKLRGGYEVDVMGPCTYEIKTWRDVGLLKPYDSERLIHLKDMFPAVLDIDGMVVNGERWFAPMDWGNSTVVYRTDLVDEEYIKENSWKILFDDRYKGKLAAFDDNVNIEIAGLLLGYDDIFSLNDEQLVEVKKLLQKQRENLRFFWAEATSMEQSLASGEIVAAYSWNESYVKLKQQGVPVGFMVPKEGIFTWCCGLTLNSKVKNEDMAYDMINGMTSPETGAYEIATWGYGHANKKAFDIVGPEKLAELNLSTPEALLNNGIFFQPLELDVRTKYNKLLEEVKAGS